MDEYLQLLEDCPPKVLRGAGWQLIATSTSDLASAYVIWEKCIGLLRAALDPPELGSEYGVFADGVNCLAEALFRYAIRLIDVGEYEQATQFSSESIEKFQRLGNCDFIAYGYGNLGRLALLRGDFEQARTLCSEAMTIAAAVGNVLALTECQPRLGMIALYDGDAAEARRLMTDTLQICMGRTNIMIMARIYTYLAEIALWEGMIAEAEQWLAQSLANHAQPRWIRLEFVDCLWVAARVATLRQQYARAATLFGLAEQLGSHIGYSPVEPVRAKVDAAFESVRAAMPPEAFAAALATGQQLTLDEAFATLLAPNQITGI
jgi:tetratricopeptide (TPR) repeat protein